MSAPPSISITPATRCRSTGSTPTASSTKPTSRWPRVRRPNRPVLVSLVASGRGPSAGAAPWRVGSGTRTQGRATVPGSASSTGGAGGRVSIEDGVVFGAGGGRELRADVFRPPADAVDGPAPGVLLVHGGGWRTGDRTQLRGYGILLARAG